MYNIYVLRSLALRTGTSSHCSHKSLTSHRRQRTHSFYCLLTLLISLAFHILFMWPQLWNRDNVLAFTLRPTMTTKETPPFFTHTHTHTNSSYRFSSYCHIYTDAHIHMYEVCSKGNVNFEIFFKYLFYIMIH